MPKIRGLGEIVIWVHDMEESLRFYSDVLGLEVMSPPDFRGARFLRAGAPAVSCPQQIVLVPLPPDAPTFPTDRKERTLHHLGIEVATEEFEEWRQRLRSHGLEPRDGEHPFLRLRGMYVDDPDGNEVELIASKD
ncbi:MAG: VOC family protein [Chloroflexota bacterium]|nr:VOC family protein [Chloroflexota bacterium]